MTLETDLEFCIKNGLNVCLSGRHGVGKTSIIKSLFEKHNLNWMYFSGATLDPYIDFVGIPKESIDPVTKQSVLDFVRPAQFANDQVEAIFIDEYNRTPKKVRNATLELIQFKSINGKKFNNLKLIWIAINPDEDDEFQYDVEPIDPAQLDRFHVFIDLPYKPNLDYFVSKYQEKISKAAIAWWNSLDKTQKLLVSPRRLDYAVDIFLQKGNIKNVISQKCGVGTLLLHLTNYDIDVKLAELCQNNDLSSAQKLFKDDNMVDFCIPHIEKEESLMKFFIPLLDGERATKLFVSNSKIQEHLLKFPSVYIEILQPISATTKLTGLLKSKLESAILSVKITSEIDPNNVIDARKFYESLHKSGGGVDTSKASAILKTLLSIIEVTTDSTLREWKKLYPTTQDVLLSLINIMNDSSDKKIFYTSILNSIIVDKLWRIYSIPIGSVGKDYNETFQVFTPSKDILKAIADSEPFDESVTATAHSY